MNEILGMSFTSSWMAFLYLMILCVAATVFERVFGRLVARGLKGGAAKAARVVLVAAACGGVLWAADALMDSVSLQVWTLVGLSVLAGVIMGLPESDK